MISHLGIYVVSRYLDRNAKNQYENSTHTLYYLFIFDVIDT